MTPHPLPPELLDLEARLARRSVPPPSQVLRVRVQAAVAAELARPPRAGWGAWLAQAAAAVLIGGSLAVIAPAIGAPPPRPAANAADVEAAAAALRQAFPDLSAREARQFALLAPHAEVARHQPSQGDAP